MVAFCKDCRFIFARDYDEMVAEATAILKATGVPTAPYWGCNHPRTYRTKPWGWLKSWSDYLLRRKPTFVSCERMRLHGAPCTPEGLLFEAKPEA